MYKTICTSKKASRILRIIILNLIMLNKSQILHTFN